jgi:hypothetical protein
MDNKINTVVEKDRITFWFNTVYLGYAYVEVDGFYTYQFVKENLGTWSAWSLRMIADILDELNKPYEESINEYFKNNPQDNNPDQFQMPEYDTL